MMTQKQVRKTKEGISFGLKVLLGILFISPLTYRLSVFHSV